MVQVSASYKNAHLEISGQQSQLQFIRVQECICSTQSQLEIFVQKKEW